MTLGSNLSPIYHPLNGKPRIPFAVLPCTLCPRYDWLGDPLLANNRAGNEGFKCRGDYSAGFVYPCANGHLPIPCPSISTVEQTNRHPESVSNDNFLTSRMASYTKTYHLPRPAFISALQFPSTLSRRSRFDTRITGSAGDVRKPRGTSSKEVEDNCGPFSGRSHPVSSV